MLDTWLVLDNCFILCHRSTSPHLACQFLCILGTCVKVILNSIIQSSSTSYLVPLKVLLQNLVFCSSIHLSKTERNISIFLSIFSCVSSTASKEVLHVYHASGRGFLWRFLPQYYLHRSGHDGMEGKQDLISCSI